MAAAAAAVPHLPTRSSSPLPDPLSVALPSLPPPPPALDALPAHTTGWSATMRGRYPSYVAAREADGSSSAAPAPSTLQVGSRVIVDCGRWREVVHIPAGAGAVRVNKSTLLLSSLIGEQIGRRYAVADHKGALHRLNHTTHRTHTALHTSATTSPTPSSAAQQEGMTEEDAEESAGEGGAAEEGRRCEDDAEEERSLAASVSVCSGGGLLVSSALPSTLLPRATNAALFDDNRSQRLSQADIERVKASPHASPASLISLLVTHSSTFHSKTEFSQEKYPRPLSGTTARQSRAGSALGLLCLTSPPPPRSLPLCPAVCALRCGRYIAKKKRKHVSEVTTVDGSLPHTVDALHLKDSSRLLHLRPDTIAQLLAASNAAASRYLLLADSTHGNLLGAFAKRMGGGGGGAGSEAAAGTAAECGRGLIVHVQAVPLNSGAQLSQLGSMRSLLTEPELQSILPIPLALVEDFDALQAAAPAELSPSSPSHSQQRPLSVFADAAAVLLEGVDSLCVCTRFDCVDLFATLFPYLRPGGSFVVHSSAAAPLASLHRTLRRQGWAVKVELTDTFYREHQVLPNRTHPHVNMSHAAGYTLSGVKAHTASRA